VKLCCVFKKELKKKGSIHEVSQVQVRATRKGFLVECPMKGNKTLPFFLHSGFGSGQEIKRPGSRVETVATRRFPLQQATTVFSASN
jgi:hypothetical protein